MELTGITGLSATVRHERQSENCPGDQIVQTAAAGGLGTPDIMARRCLRADDRPGRRASDITTGARADCLAGETQRMRARGRPVRPAARGARGCGE